MITNEEMKAFIKPNDTVDVNIERIGVMLEAFKDFCLNGGIVMCIDSYDLTIVDISYIRNELGFDVYCHREPYVYHSKTYISIKN